MDHDLADKLRGLGVKSELIKNTGYSFFAVISSDEHKEGLAQERLTWNGSLRNGYSNYSVISGGTNGGCESSVVIDGVEYSQNHRGLNFVIYDEKSNHVIDTVCFDTHESLEAIR